MVVEMVGGLITPPLAQQLELQIRVAAVAVIISTTSQVVPVGQASSF